MNLYSHTPLDEVIYHVDKKHKTQRQGVWTPVNFNGFSRELPK